MRGAGPRLACEASTVIHHTLLHEGFGAPGSANRTVSFYRPDGTYIAATPPRRRQP